MLHTTITTEDNKTAMRYHQTKVAEWDRDTNIITLNTGGWETPATKKRMNQFSETLGLGFKVYQKDGQWIVIRKDIDPNDSFLTFFNNDIAEFEVFKV